MIIVGFRARGKSADLSTFKSALIELYSDIGMPYDRSELDFISIRDKIVHTGRFPPGYQPSSRIQKVDESVRPNSANCAGLSRKAISEYREGLCQRNAALNT